MRLVTNKETLTKCHQINKYLTLLTPLDAFIKSDQMFIELITELYFTNQIDREDVLHVLYDIYHIDDKLNEFSDRVLVELVHLEVESNSIAQLNRHDSQNALLDSYQCLDYFMQHENELIRKDALNKLTTLHSVQSSTLEMQSLFKAVKHLSCDFRYFSSHACRLLSSNDEWSYVDDYLAINIDVLGHKYSFSLRVEDHRYYLSNTVFLEDLDRHSIHYEIADHYSVLRLSSNDLTLSELYNSLRFLLVKVTPDHYLDM